MKQTNDFTGVAYATSAGIVGFAAIVAMITLLRRRYTCVRASRAVGGGSRRGRGKKGERYAYAAVGAEEGADEPTWEEAPSRTLAPASATVRPHDLSDEEADAEDAALRSSLLSQPAVTIGDAANVWGGRSRQVGTRDAVPAPLPMSEWMEPEPEPAPAPTAPAVAQAPPLALAEPPDDLSADEERAARKLAFQRRGLDMDD
jgi:hypothetical protein